MKVLMVNSVCGIRSTGRICTDLADELMAQGHEVKIAYGRESVPKKYQKCAVRIGSDLEVGLNALKARFFDNEGLNAVRATRKFIAWVKCYDPDVIHLHNIHGYYLNYKILFEYLRTCGKKVVWTLHDCWAITGHTAYCDAVCCDKWKNGCDRCPQIKEYPKAFIDRSKRNWELKKKILTAIPGMTLITPSHWLMELVKQSFLCDYPVKVIHNGIDTSSFARQPERIFKLQHGVEGKKLVLGVASTWDENKGYSDFLEIATLLGEDYQVLLVGLTEKQKANLPMNVMGIEKTNGVKELAQIYSEADCLLNLSKTENYPTVNIEAMCCGTPVITYDVGGSRESVESAGGIVVEKSDLVGIVRAIKSHSAKCEINIQMFDKVRAIEQYIQVINSMQ